MTLDELPAVELSLDKLGKGTKEILFELGYMGVATRKEERLSIIKTDDLESLILVARAAQKLYLRRGYMGSEEDTYWRRIQELLELPERDDEKSPSHPY